MTVATAAVDGALARQLRTRTAEVIAGAKAYDVPALCTRLGLASGDEAEAMGSKFKYAHSRLMTIAVERLLPIAQTLLAERSDEHTSELQSLMRISYAVFCLKKKKIHTRDQVDTKYVSTLL